EIEETSQREEALRRERRIIRRACIGPEDQRVAAERARDQPRRLEGIEVLIRSQTAAFPEPLELELLSVAREENAIQLVVGTTREHTAALDVGRGKLRISDQDARSFRSTPQADTNLPPIGKLAPEIDASIRRADSILCHSIAVLQTEDTTLFEIELRRKEVSTGERQWLVELGE